MKRYYIILGSGVTLGIYIPALLVNHQLKTRGFNTELYILEELFKTDKQVKIPVTKTAFHRNFRFALMGQKMTQNILENIDPIRLNHLLHKWPQDEQTNILVFSGYWMPIIEKYLESSKLKNINVYLCHMDAENAASWSHLKNDRSCYHHVWFCNFERNEISSYIDISGSKPLSYTERKNRLIVHGGGWGIGTYKKCIPELLENDFLLDVIAYELNDMEATDKAIQYHLIDPQWNAWERDAEGNFIFPPLGEYQGNGSTEFINDDKCSVVYPIIHKSKAIISKPGGATLLDSLASATPLVYLDSFGDYESKNALLWKRFGFGISFQEWKKLDFSMKKLEEMHLNLLNIRTSLKNYMENFYAA